MTYLLYQARYSPRLKGAAKRRGRGSRHEWNASLTTMFPTSRDFEISGDDRAHGVSRLLQRTQCELSTATQGQQLAWRTRRRTAEVPQKADRIAEAPRTEKVCPVSRVPPVQTALRNCTGDEGGPFGFGDQVADSKPPQAAAVKSRGGERCGKVGTMIPAGMVERGERKRTAAEASKFS
jgi:hypothetical protein